MNFKVHQKRKNSRSIGRKRFSVASAEEKGFQHIHAFPQSACAIAREPQVAMAADDVTQGVVPCGTVDPFPFACGHRFEGETCERAGVFKLVENKPRRFRRMGLEPVPQGGEFAESSGNFLRGCLFEKFAVAAAVGRVQDRPEVVAVRSGVGESVGNPLELGLQWMIDFSKESFAGSEKIFAQRERGVKNKLVALNSNAPLQPGTKVFDGSIPAGTICVSKTCGKKHLELGLFDAKYALSGFEFSSIPNGACDEKTVSRPFILAQSLIKGMEQQ